ncbi:MULTISPECIES: tripartite tricarboxylate transporter substrate binding protein [Aliivibrio]|uniref:Tripartite tricarboxylate transporter substrate binding protein n=1 Tax=Aliivibrio finisterrensis TaxID=511998 RepID=A0A4Q5KS45_9GAMM|nr:MULTISPECIES: tripartite tricarboxylate transporter substrate binding protein [Aliivibrio]MDD9179427.1 tripartite tricarboxylate transporter substrate binding protein [Aliivibrio sp. A6]RYU49990.1 tripartite tricarboxylate transporter substrate binding protein [Aliivibrio finisterrensis]RYU50637.1 tripartite tricarboxylate transporter substrate binding protein [Aliivibrio finisterrensis]RYU56698.1 tripartite tricarboxylate transporter substrate binding protein [Aliivibrio finisterrensis]RYU
MLTSFKKQFTASIIAASFALSGSAIAAELEKIHFIIPGGAGGGWDMTARGTGDVLLKSDIIEQASYQNLSGGGGGKAIAHLIETAERQPDTLMVNSTPIVIRSLSGIFPQSFRDLTPIAATIADYGAIVVNKDSKYTSWEQVVADFEKDPRSVKIAGGSARGSMDHLVAAAAFKGEGFDARKVRYIAYDAGGKAMAALLSGETPLLSTGLGEVLEMSKSGQVRILAITAPKRLESAPDIPTLTEYGNDTVFANWRGFFAAPGTPQAKIDEYREAFDKMYETEQWAVVRDRNGWIDNYKADKDFYIFLEEQELLMGNLMRELGFLK